MSYQTMHSRRNTCGEQTVQLLAEISNIIEIGVYIIHKNLLVQSTSGLRYQPKRRCNKMF